MPTMPKLIGCFVLLLCGLVTSAPIVLAQSETAPQTIKGDLLSIKGDVYIIKDLSGRLVYLRVDKNTKHERLLLPGEKIEADVLPGVRVVALRPVK